jgi:SAM-dependent methyltransferase
MCRLIQEGSKGESDVREFGIHEIRELYREHPLRRDRILARVLSRRATLEGLAERDLAEDPLTEITDQNHVGGSLFVEELARKSGIVPGSEVLDLGCGLGGADRYLAEVYGCCVHGVDLSPERCLDADALTRLVGLQHRVTFECGDISTLPLPRRRFDVLWGQGAWAHLRDKQAFIQKWSACLIGGSRIAMEEACLKRDLYTKIEADLADALEQNWKCHLVKPKVWTDLMVKEGFDVEIQEDLSRDLHDYYFRLLEIDSQLPSDEVTTMEKAGWSGAVKLTDSAALGYFRIVARKR